MFPHEQSRRLRVAGVGERVAEAGGREAEVDADGAVDCGVWGLLGVEGLVWGGGGGGRGC